MVVSSISSICFSASSLKELTRTVHDGRCSQSGTRVSRWNADDLNMKMGVVRGPYKGKETGESALLRQMLEPRVIKRRRHGHPLMQKPRNVLRAELRKHFT